MSEKVIFNLCDPMKENVVLTDILFASVWIRNSGHVKNWITKMNFFMGMFVGSIKI